MKTHTRNTAALTAAFAALIAALPAYAQTTYNWVGGSATNGNIATSGNVSPAFVSSSGSVLTFGSSALTGSARTTAVVGAGIDLHRLSFGGANDNHDFTLSGSQLITLKAFNSTNPSILNNSSRTHLVSAPLKLDNPLTLGGDGSGTVTISGAITTGGQAFTKSGTSTFVLSSSSVSGSMAMTLQGGTLAVGHNNALGTSGAISFTGGTLRYNSGVTTDYSARIALATAADQNRRIDIVNGHSVTFASALGTNSSLTKLGGGTLILSGNNTYSGGTTLSDGYVQLGSANAIGTSGTINFAGGGLRATASNSTDYSARFSTAAGQQYKIDTNGRNVTWASNLQSSGGSLTKNGTGTLTLTGNNTYSGNTNVNAGTLTFGTATALSANTKLLIANGASVNFFNTQGGTQVANGSELTVNGALNGNFVINSGATLSGSGTINGNVTVFGKIAPGNSPGTQTINGDAIFQGGGEYDWEVFNAAGVAGTGYDTLNITGALDLSALSSSNKFTVNVISLSAIAPDVFGDAVNFDDTGAFSWILASSSNIIGFDANKFDVNVTGFTNAHNGVFSVATAGNNLMLVYSAIPEPSSAALLFGASALVLVGSRRRKVRA